MNPATSDRNLTPSSTALSGPVSMSVGTGLLGQSIWGAAAPTTMLSPFVVDCAPAVTRTVKLAVPAAVGVPLICPEAWVRVRPAGSVPLASDQLYGGVPPVAASVAE